MITPHHVGSGFFRKERPIPRLYAITDEKVLPNDQLIAKVKEVLEAGVRLLQVRFKETLPQEQLRLGRELRLLTRGYEAVLIVNDSPHLAKEVEADGVHLGACDSAVSEARKLLGKEAVIGVSCYEDAELVRRWGPDEVSYIGLSSPYPSITKRKEVVSLSRFKELVAASRVPAYAIGGITPDRVSEMVGAGCWGVAVISAIFGAKHPGEEVKRFISQIEGNSTHLNP